MKQPKICVIGACNVDLASRSKRMPNWGETLRGSNFNVSFGGKGANQAIMAANLNSEVTMVSKIGFDIFGSGVIENLKHYGMDTGQIYRTDKAHTGAAQVMVDPEGRNAIIVCTGSNDYMNIDEVENARDYIIQADVLLLQCEIPIGISLVAMKIAKAAGTKVIFNTAPVSGPLPDEILGYCDIVCLNESEIAVLTGIEINSIEDARTATKSLMKKGAISVVLTLGEKGVIYQSKDESLTIEPIKVITKDTTGAGDCFIGSFAYFYAIGRPIGECLTKANLIAALSVQKEGTQASFPKMEQLKVVLEDFG